jgi:hypothetical protein
MGKSQGGHSSLDEYQRRVDEALSLGTLRLITSGEAVPKQNGSITVQLSERTLPDFTKQVSTGAKWLDEVDPGWWRAIDTGTLDLDDENVCVLGQSWNHYARKTGLNMSGVGRSGFRRFVDRFWGGDHDKTAKHGFAFEDSVYAWINTEARKRIANGERPTAVRYPNALDGTNMAWQLDSECWEHLTKTWLVLVQARQEGESETRRKLILNLESLSPEEIADRILDGDLTATEA